MRALTVVAVVTTMLSLPTLAEERGAGAFLGQDEVDVSFPASRTRLEAQGYRAVKQINGDPLRLRAFDTEGSEVVLGISPQTGEIYRSDYVHPMDE